MSSVTDGWPVVGKSNITDCEPCLLGKASRQPFPLGNREPRELCELIHSDLQGPFRIPGIDGSRYSVEFTEHRSRMAFAYPIPDKNSHTILEKFHEFKSWIENLTGKYVKVLRTDRGGEFFGAVYTYLKTRRYSAPNHRSLLKSAKRHRRTLAPDSTGSCTRYIGAHETAKETMAIPTRDGGLLTLANLVSSLRHDAIRSSHGDRPNVAHLRQLGSAAFMVIPDKGRDKMGNRARKSYLVGYGHPEGTKAYLLWDPVRDVVAHSRDIIIKEEMVLDEKYQQDPANLDLLDDDADEEDPEYSVEAILDERQPRRTVSNISSSGLATLLPRGSQLPHYVTPRP